MMADCYHRLTILVPVDPERGTFLVAGVGLSKRGEGDEEVLTIDLNDAQLVDNGEVAREVLRVSGADFVDLTKAAQRA